MKECKMMEIESRSRKRKLLIYAKNNRREDLEKLHSQGKLEGYINTLQRKVLLCGHEDLGKWFLHIGANLENMSKHYPLLHFVASKGYSNFLKVLLEKRSVDTNVFDANNETALHLAIKNGNLECCRLLLQFGARTDIPDQNGLKPLHRAVKDQSIAKMIDLLLEFNADIEDIDKHSKRPLEYAFERSFNKRVIVCHLIKVGAKVGTTFVSQGSFYGKNAVQIGQVFGMTTYILRAIRYRSSEVNTNDLSVLDCVNLTGDIGALVDILMEDGNIMTLCDANKHDTIERLLSYVERTESHRLYQCMNERGLLMEKIPPYACNQDKIDTLAEPLTDDDIYRNAVKDTRVPSNERTQSEKRAMVLHFEAVDDDDEFILTRGKNEWPNKQLIDANSVELIVVVSPSKDEQSIQKVVKLAAQHILHRARGVLGNVPLTFTHVHTREFLADPTSLYEIRPGHQYSALDSKDNTAIANDALLEKKLKLTGKESSYDCHPLHHHVLHNEVEELSKLLHNDETVDVNVKDDAGWTTLNLAILLGEREIVKVLLDHGATATLDMVQCLPAFVCGDWDRNALTEISSLILSVRLNLTHILQMLSERNPRHPSMDLCIKLSYGLKVESVLLDSVCETAERKYQDIGARFKPTYTVHMSQPIRRVCLGFSDKVCDIEEKDDIHGVQIAIMNKDISPESVWIEDTEMKEDEKVVSKAIINLWADYLWDKHPNLNAITAGSLVRIKYPENKPVGHIILHCSHKGYIPQESEIFPTELICEKGAMPVAVIEGEFRLGPKDPPSTKSPASGSIAGRSIASMEKAATEKEEPDQSNNVIRIHSTKDGRRYPMKTKEHITLKIGMHLCKSDPSNEVASEGTLGIFVEMGNNKTGLVTCAHVFHKEEINKGRHSIYFPCPQQMCGTYVIAPLDSFEEEVVRQVEKMDLVNEPDTESDCNVSDDVYWECGKVVRAVFDSTLDIGIDAALIEIDPVRVPRDGSFDYIKGAHLRNAGFDWRKPPVFTSGIQADSEYLRQSVTSSERPIKCMKLGGSSGLSVGILTCAHGQVRISDSDPLGIERDSINKHILKNQIVITEYNRKQFFELGDSGSAVFVIKGGKGHYYPDACLGIAIGFLDNKTFVTPIESVLETLKSDIAPEITLKKFT